ncbi:hypothetical protein KQI61_07790 [Anaerocolumna aminovalerica]|uniref:hypothetical protein n=1 Tax=Anaerocolumna aminovalerica TaxID=1527 RepID=UPI001C0EA832|nr:hypothetical protein [Anaerocolumna aminovalerica]MBU5332098.1 hypothetical protein [Anaerocolumna aminovalerica]
MANVKKGTTKQTEKVLTDVVEENINQSNENDSELKRLLKENEDLKNQIDQINKSIIALKEQEKVQLVKSEENIYEDEYEEISPHRPISVVSLSDGGVNLRTSIGSNGKIFRFDKFGHKLSIVHSDLLDILSTCRSFIEDGTVYICDKQFVKNNYLEDKYNKFLTLDKITNILDFDIESIKEMVGNTTPTIQDTIISLLVKKINNNESVDFNKIEAIGNACVKPCNIRDLAHKMSNQ